MDTLVRIEKVSKYFNAKTGGINTALEDVTIELESGMIYGVVGESGSGKSTLGRISTGLTYPSKGKVIIQDVEISHLKDKEVFRLAQYIHQDPYGSLDVYMTVREVLERPLIYLMNVKDSSEREDKILAMLDEVGLDVSFENRTIQELSGGERQRVLVARAFIVNPVLIVADEPTSMIDAVHRQDILAIISRLGKKSGKTIMFITHDIGIANSISDYFFIMYKGRVIEAGNSSDVYNKPLHPYTQLLMSVSPEKIINAGGINMNESSKMNLNLRIVSGAKKMCPYSSNCPFVFDKCRTEIPELQGPKSHSVACFLY
ncbi:MAG: ABC transporter ATP-binding protein [Candidatus Parvarchaeota archaeon]